MCRSHAEHSGMMDSVVTTGQGEFTTDEQNLFQQLSDPYTKGF